VVRLLPMTEEDYRNYLEFAIPNYAQEQVKAGAWHPEGARQKAEAAFRVLLPDGLASPGQYLCVVVDETQGERVGCLWYGVRDGDSGKFAAIYDIVIWEPFRRRGHGIQTMEALEEKVKELGLKEIMLHVFGYNIGARALYRKMGYVEANITMARRL
jgi:ribosomal protein S18 acetylase RimI-like enzyme